MTRHFETVVTLLVRRAVANLTAMSRWFLLMFSAVTLLVLLAAQTAAATDFLLYPPPYSPEASPRGPIDALLGAIAAAGGFLGLLLALTCGVVGLAVAVEARAVAWVIGVVASGVIAVLGLFVVALVMLSSPANAFHPFVVFAVVPLTTLIFARARRRGDPR
jgi:hypothetical protein